MIDLLKKHGGKTSRELYKENDKGNNKDKKTAKYVVPACVAFLAGVSTIIVAAVPTTREFSKNLLSKIFRTQISNGLFAALFGGVAVGLFIVSSVCADKANKKIIKEAKATSFTDKEKEAEGKKQKEKIYKF